MANDIRIPPAALEAGARAIEQSLLTSQMSAAEPVYAAEARAAFLAMIAAWPWMSHLRENDSASIREMAALVLPLPTQENGDAE